MKSIFLRMNELNKYNIINDLVLGKINKNRASFILNLTRRQINLSLNSKMKGKLVLFMVIEIKNLQLLFLKKLIIQ
ncbi:hypothetical protein [Pseudostreptobacillus hongkongensis]|uniref:hypothetical protein n=1 Tax=Pseudostreptobacillus hongkongensis TaxID=1162717 RepID=UPI00082E41FA|nr:hypothetical protein [Pseudostreptobacillus hongkongensis]